MVGPQPLVGPSRCNPYGRCFYPSAVVCTNVAVQTAVRDSTGFLNNPVLQNNESVQADTSRATTSQFMCEHVDEYIGFEGEALHVDITHVSIIFTRRTHQFDIEFNR